MYFFIFCGERERIRGIKEWLADKRRKDRKWGGGRRGKLTNTDYVFMNFYLFLKLMEGFLHRCCCCVLTWTLLWLFSHKTQKRHRKSIGISGGLGLFSCVIYVEPAEEMSRTIRVLLGNRCWPESRVLGANCQRELREPRVWFYDFQPLFQELQQNYPKDYTQN